MTPSLFDILWLDKTLNTYLSVGSINPTKFRTFHLSDAENAEKYMFDQAGAINSYYRISSVAAPLARGRGDAEDSAYLPCLHVDFDIDNGTDAHKAKHYPKSLEELQEFLSDSDIPEMTVLVNSGNGYHGYVVFDEPLDVRTADAQMEADKLLKGFLAAINSLAKDRGWKFDNTAELARVLRYPGTLNHKSNPAKNVEIVSYSGKYHSRETVSAWVAANAPKQKPSKKFDRKPRGANDNAKDEASFESILAGCEYVRLCVEAPMSEPDWYAFASIVGNTADGERLWHEISSQDTRYDEAEASAKLKHALEAAGPRHCSEIGGTLGCTACATCPFNGNIVSPIKLGYANPNLVKLMKEHIYDVQTRRYLEIASGVFLSPSSFNDKYRHIIDGAGPHGKFLLSKLARKVDQLSYLPGDNNQYPVLDNGLTSYNLWRPSGLTASHGDCSTLMSHISLMMPDKMVEDHFLNCLAHMVKKPGVKIPHMFVLIGTQGNGKSALLKLISKLLGLHNCRTLESNHLGMRFNAPLGNIQMLMVEELKAADRLEVYNNIKTMITEPTFTVEQKNIDLYEARTPDWVMATSNHPMPIALESMERRVMLYESKLARQSAEYYNSLWDAINVEAAAFLAMLLDRDISGFNPNAEPPMTQTKIDVMQASRPMVEQDIAAMMEDREGLFAKDLVKMTDIQDRLQARYRGNRPSNNVVSMALKALGAVHLRNVRLTVGQARFWAVRNGDHWENAPDEQIRDHYQNPRPFAA